MAQSTSDALVSDFSSLTAGNDYKEALRQKAARILRANGHPEAAAVVAGESEATEEATLYLDEAIRDRDVPGAIKHCQLFPVKNRIDAERLAAGNFAEFVSLLWQLAGLLLTVSPTEEMAKEAKQLLFDLKRLRFKSEEMRAIDRLLRHAELPGFSRLAAFYPPIAEELLAAQNADSRRAAALLDGLQQLFWGVVNETLPETDQPRQHRPMRIGKTARQRATGVTARHQANKARRAEANRQRAQGKGSK